MPTFPILAVPQALRAIPSIHHIASKTWMIYLLRFHTQLFELFLYIITLVSIKGDVDSVSMLNFLSFFLYPDIHQYTKKLFLFRCSMFWAFSLFNAIMQYQNWLDPCFDAQCFELFLYLGVKKSLTISFWRGFDAQYFELFLYPCTRD